MTEKTITIRPQLDISCRFGLGSDAPLSVVADKEELAVDADGSKLITVEIVPPLAGAPEPEARLVFHRGESSDFRLLAWTQLSETVFEAWDGDGSPCCHRLLKAAESPIKIHVALLKAEEPTPSGPPAPGSGSAVVKVTVRKKDSMPLVVPAP